MAPQAAPFCQRLLLSVMLGKAAVIIDEAVMLISHRCTATVLGSSEACDVTAAWLIDG